MSTMMQMSSISHLCIPEVLCPLLYTQVILNLIGAMGSNGVQHKTALLIVAHEFTVQC
jgi:hypothetical protein